MNATITPYLCARNAAAAVDFYVKTFGAEEILRLDQPDGRLGHCELKIGDGVVMLADEFPELEFFSPEHLNGTSVSVHILVPDVDTTIEKAVAAGATLQRPVKDEFYGHRTGTIIDPFGHRWLIGTVIEDLSTEEIKKRASAQIGA
jgi:PhnB protein